MMDGGVDWWNYLDYLTSLPGPKAGSWFNPNRVPPEIAYITTLITVDDPVVLLKG